MSRIARNRAPRWGLVNNPGSLEDEIIDSLPKSADSSQVYTPYTCKLFDILEDGTADTDIDHIVALAEAYDSGHREELFKGKE